MSYLWRFQRWRSTLLVAAVLLAVLVALPAAAQPSPVTITLYNAQHVPVAEAWVNDFTAQTGIKVQIRSGRDFELANLLLQEGERSPADVFITENSPAMTAVANGGLFAPVDATTLAQVPTAFSSPVGDWTGIAARSTVFVYNPSRLPADQLPSSMMDLADPSWKGTIGIAPAGADFQAIVSAVLELRGPEATVAWLEGLKANARIFNGNRAIMAAANTGEVAGGIIYHYYWYGDRNESGANSANVELHYFLNKDPGGFVSVSGGGVLKSSKYPAAAQRFLEYITSARGQQMLADSNAMEYAIASNVPNPKLKPLGELDPPLIDISRLNGPKVIELMQRAGLI
ncbi:MAG: iron ABC transporter substrate-binding protein [Chloroflexota bacterium]